jgi:hypothetical protein
MALTQADEELLQYAYNNLNPEIALKPGDDRYEHIYDRPECPDPIHKISKRIKLSGVESTTFFSGFRGSGKTTELFRLKKSLEDSGYFVLYADALSYINSSLPIEITDLLIVLAGAFSDALAERSVQIASESYWTRLWNWMTKTNVELKEITLKGEAGVDPVKAGADLKLELKSTPSFRQRLSDALKDRIGDLRDDVAGFFEDGYKAIEAKFGATRIVFLFDSLEQIRGSLSDEKNVIRSVELLFSNHLRMLSIPYIHMVYTVPPWLKFVLKGVDMAVIPCIRIWERDNYQIACEGGMEAMRSLVTRRFPPHGVERFFGPQHAKRLDRYISLSGGHFRDLLQLFRETIVQTEALPVPQEIVERAIVEVRSHFMPIPVEDARWLAQIAKEKASPLKNDSSDEVSRLTRFLDSHIVLYLRNGEEWYDIHPLVREEVARIVAANQP